MEENKDYLTKLDQQNGDGDLGISMTKGFGAVRAYLASTDETDIGRLFMKSSSAMNEAASSTLGTIMSVALMGMAQALKGKAEAALPEIARAMQGAVERIMEKAGSAPGEKTVLDAVCPGVDALIQSADEGTEIALKAAMDASRVGAESTKQMKPVHGRAAYYGDKSIGMVDGGSVAGSLIFEALYRSSQ
jgi:dihydroxyacetone kinase